MCVTCEHEVLELDELVHDIPGKEAAHHGANGADHDDEGDAAETHSYEVLQVQQSWAYDTLHDSQDWIMYVMVSIFGLILNTVFSTNPGMH